VNEEILEDLTCLEGLMKMKKKLDLGLKTGTLKSGAWGCVVVKALRY
jgi:hypothetical protein